MLYLLNKNITLSILMVDKLSKNNSIHIILSYSGRPMDIRLVGGVDDGSRPQSNRLSLSNGNGARNQRFGNRNNNQQNGFRGNRPRGGGRQQQNGTNGKKEEVSADDLDAELDAYRAESKQKK
jgi:hypothetical protein